MQNTSGIRPRGDMLLVRPLVVEETSTGGIVIPRAHIDKEEMAQTNGVVIAVGPYAAKSHRMEGVDVGALIIFARYAGLAETGSDDVKYRLIRGDDVIALRDAPSSERPRAMVSPNKAFDIV